MLWQARPVPPDVPPGPGPQSLDPRELALVGECARKSQVSWIAWADEPERLVWHAWLDERGGGPALVILDGDTGQRLPGLVASGQVRVTMRSRDTGGAVVTWTGHVTALEPGSPGWQAHVAALLAARLNLPEPASAAERWAECCTVLRVVPTATLGPAPGPLP